jgi:hypothetical protein
MVKGESDECANWIDEQPTTIANHKPGNNFGENISDYLTCPHSMQFAPCVAFDRHPHCAVTLQHALGRQLFELHPAPAIVPNTIACPGPNRHADSATAPSPSCHAARQINWIIAFASHLCFGRAKLLLSRNPI